jgi:hypothetical protein
LTMHTVRTVRCFSAVACVALLMRCLPVIAQDKDIAVLPNRRGRMPWKCRQVGCLPSNFSANCGGPRGGIL